MTKPPYHDGWTAGSQVCGLAPSPGDCAWNVNFNNGNANWNNRNNSGFVRAVRARECPDAVSFRELYAAWREARRGKKPSASQLAFECYWLDRLLDLQAELNAGTWRPAPPTCFVAQQPKAREIHAPDFRDRVVHHWLVPQLERVYEPLFVHDAHSNRRGKGTHSAVERLQRFLREVDSGQGGGWYLQLDVFNFFNSIHRPTLLQLLDARLARARASALARATVRALLERSPIADGVRYIGTPAELGAVPPHKRLAEASPDCGISIGNLSSQFFANVYLNELDQFVKHALRARRYVRYVDDFVLVHRDREQLEAWRVAIGRFLEEHLQLRLKADAQLQRLDAGVDFLGYIVRPTHKLVRTRVVLHARAKLAAWQRSCVGRHGIRATPRQLRDLKSVWMSYVGHFRHAACGLLEQRFHREFPWLRAALRPRSIDYRCEGRRLSLPLLEASA
jgi:retron-type reverse transcriptase